MQILHEPHLEILRHFLRRLFHLWREVYIKECVTFMRKEAEICFFNTFYAKKICKDIYEHVGNKNASGAVSEQK